MKNSALLAICMLISTSPAFAASVPDGKIIVRIDDGVSTRCINSSKDAITMHMRRLITQKQEGLFTEDKEAALIINTVLSGEEGSAGYRKTAFPRLFTATVQPYAKGYVSLPLEEKIFSRFALEHQSAKYDSAELEFAVLAKKKKAPFGIALAALADVSKSMPLPINPFSEGFKYFSDYANKVVDGSLTEQNNVANQSKEGKIVLSFSASDVCTGDQEQTGTLAVVTGAKGQEAEGYIDIKNEYCWKADIKPVFILKFASKPANGCAAATSYVQLSNPYMAFYLGATPVIGTEAKTAQAKLISPSKTETVGLKVDEKSIEKSIFAAFQQSRVANDQGISASAAKKLSQRVSSFLKNEKLIPKSPSSANIIALPTTAADSVAIDLTESFKRCAAHGTPVDQCL